MTMKTKTIKEKRYFVYRVLKKQCLHNDELQDIIYRYCTCYENDWHHINVDFMHIIAAYTKAVESLSLEDLYFVCNNIKYDLFAYKITGNKVYLE